MANPLRGRSWIFDGIMDVDWEIFPYFEVPKLVREGLGNYEEAGKLAFTKVDPGFPEKVRKGDFVVGAENFGYGHDHDSGAKAIKGSGVAAVLCESAGPYFLRNGLEHGLPVVEVTGIRAATEPGDEIELDLEQGCVTNLRSGQRLTFKPFPGFLMEMLEAGGIYPLIEQRITSGTFQQER